MTALANFVSRSDLGWGATKADLSNTNLGMVAHYDSRNGHVYEKDHVTPKPHTECREYWNDTRQMHIRSNGWKDVGYAYFVCPHDYIFAGREWGHMQAAELPTSGKIQSGNARYVAVTFATGPLEKPNEAQLNAWYRLRAWLTDVKKVGSAVHGHRDFTFTDCPGDGLYRMVLSGILKKKAAGEVTTTEENAMASLPLLQKGDKGKHVLTLRALLFERYLSGRYEKDSSDLFEWLRDEEFTKDLEADVKAYQGWRHLDADGLVGTKTWTNLTGV